MRPRFSFSRGEDLESPGEPGDAELIPGEQTLDSGGPDSAPIRPDMGPPAPGPQSGNQLGSGLGLIISVAVAAVVFVLAIYATGSPTANPLPLAQTTNALFWVVGAVAMVAAGFGALYADRTAFRGTQGGVALTNLGGSFYDFEAQHFTGTSRRSLASPPDGWGGRAAAEWAMKLAAGEGFGGTTSGLIETMRVLDRIYARDALQANRTSLLVAQS